MSNLKELLELNVREKPKVYSYKGYRIYWKKYLYLEWYKYCHIAKNPHRNFKITGKFNDWFKPDLFAEPITEHKVLKKSKNKITIEFDLRNDLISILFAFLKIMLERKKQFKHEAYAKYQPAKLDQKYSLDTLKQDRIIYTAKERGVENYKIAKHFNSISDKLYEYKDAPKAKRLAFNKKHPDKAQDFAAEMKKIDTNIGKARNRVKARLKNIQKGGFL